MILLRFYFVILCISISYFPLLASPSSEKNIPLDSLLMQYYEKAAALMGEGELDAAQAFFDKAFATKGVKQSPVYPVLLNEQGTLFFYYGELEKARSTKQQVLPYLSQLSDLEKHISVYNDLGILSHRFNQNDSAIYYYDKALDAAERYKDASWLANLHMNVSVFYFNLKRYTEAEQHIDQAVRYVVQTDDRQTTLYTWQVRAAIKAQQGKMDESGQSMQKAWTLACADGGNADWQMRCIPSLYRYFKSNHQPDSIRYYIKRGNQLLPKLPANSVSVTGFIQIRQEENYENGKYQEALNDLLLLNHQQAGTNKLSLYEKMARCYQHLNQHAKAFAYMDSARMWTDSLGREKVTAGMADFEVKYKTQAKELEIAQLQQKVTQREAALLRAGLVLLSLLAVILLVIFRSKQKQLKGQKEIEQLKHEKEITAARSYIEGMEEECKYFAKELHDGIANDLLGLQFKMAAADKQGNHTFPELIEKIRNEVRNISHELMPPEFDLLSLPQILERYLATLQENTGISTRFTCPTKDAADLSHDVAREIYRIVQEMTSNIVQHGAARHIEVALRLNTNGTSQLTIADDGKPCATTSQQPHSGIGLRTVQDRIKALDGTITQQTQQGNNLVTITFTHKPYELPDNSCR